jgi:hypothetical protein
MTRRLTILASTGAVAALFCFASPASAQEEAVRILTLACANQADGARIAPDRLAQATLISLEFLPIDLPPGETAAGFLRRVSTDASAGRGWTGQRDVEGRIQELENYVRLLPANAPIRVEGTPPDQPRFNWIFSDVPPVALYCVKSSTPEQAPAPLGSGRLRLRGSVDALAATGPAVVSADAATVSIVRTRTSLDDGSTKTVTDFAVDATVGLRLTNDDSAGTAFLFADYSLSRSRTRPRPALGGGTDEGDGDTNSLALGATGKLYLPVGSAILTTSIDAAYLNDFTQDSQLGRLRLSIRPALPTTSSIQSILPCYLGSYRQIGGQESGLWTRCGVTFQVEGAHVFERGRGEFAATDNYLAVGGTLSYEALLISDAPSSGLGTAGGPFARVTYRYLPILSGNLDDIERLEARLGYRVFTPDGIGIEFSASYLRGTNEKSFADENILSLGVGIIF